MDKKKVLIIEDDPQLLKVLSDKFSNEGFSVSEARNGKEGLEKVITDNPEVILLDIIMPVMDGITMLEEMKKNENIKGIPVVVLTNLGSAEDVENAIERGARDYLIKTDWKLDEIVEKVKNRMQNS